MQDPPYSTTPGAADSGGDLAADDPGDGGPDDAGSGELGLGLDDQDPDEAQRAGDLADWVREVFAPAITRDWNPSGALAWCRQWWAHPEAVARLLALQEAWTVLVAGPDAPGDGASTWWVSHVDYHLQVLMHPTIGPFSRCTHAHKPAEPLPCDDPPEGGLYLPLVAGDHREIEPPDAADAAAALDN